MRPTHGLLLGLMLAGCGNASGPNEGLYSQVRLDRTRVTRGDDVTITVTVRGYGTLQGSSACLTGYSVLDASGAVVAPLDVVCPADLVDVAVPAGGLVRQFVWQGRTGSADGGVPLPAGVYHVVGGPGPSGSARGSVSAPVAVEIAEP